MGLGRSILIALPLVAWAACSADATRDGTPGPGPDGGATTEDGGGISDGKGGSGDDGATTIPGLDGGTLVAGNPHGSCTTGVPAQGKLVDTSHPTAVVGTGTAASCTFSALEAAVTAGGVVTFDCGRDLVTIAVTATLNVPTNKDTVIDGSGKIMLDGGGAVQILRFDSPGWQTNNSRLTLQRLALVNGKTTPTQAIPAAPAPCSQGFDDGQGGALYVRDGNVTVIDSIFSNNQAALIGPDTGGGAIYIQGSKHGLLIVGSTFASNKASNGGGVGCLFAELDVYNTLVTGNVGTGHDANSADPKQCSAINNGQNEIGSGGNGGALYSDGQSTTQNPVNIVLCGDAIENNAAGVNAFGGGIFFTSNNFGGTLSIADSTITGNTGGHWTNVSTGSVTNAGTAVGTNAKSITIANSTVQGYP
jgi:hypothetical protein